MHSAKFSPKRSGKILATIAFQIPVPANTNIYATPQTHATPQTYIDLARPQNVHVHALLEGAREKKSRSTS